MYLFWLVLTFFSMHTSISADKTPIRVTVHSLRNDKGFVLLSLYQSEDGFPGNASKAIQLKKVKASGTSVEVTLDPLPAGSYAISILHDENDNGKMDTGAFGIPKEGYGASNDAKASFGPPSFKDAHFEHKQDTQIKIKMRYF